LQSKEEFYQKLEEAAALSNSANLTKGWIGSNYRCLSELEVLHPRVGLFAVPVI
jgi:hypothetical protein